MPNMPASAATRPRMTRLTSIATLVLAATLGVSGVSAQEVPAPENADLAQKMGVAATADFVRAVPVEMRDGTWLYADLVVPRDAGEKSKRSTILVKMPYDSKVFAAAGGGGPSAFMGATKALVDKGYVFAVVYDR